VQSRRAAVTPSNATPTVVDDPEVFSPELFPIEIKAIQAFRAKESHQAPAIRYQRGVRVGGFLVPFGRRLAGAYSSFPTFLSGRFIKAHDHPLLLVVVLRRLYIAVIADSQGRFA
jgi:hypothetical protein